MLAYAAPRIPALKRLILPRGRRSCASMHLAAFAEQGLHHTREKTGILLFASLLEHRVTVLADRGITLKLHPGT